MIINESAENYLETILVLSGQLPFLSSSALYHIVISIAISFLLLKSYLSAYVL